MESDISDSNCDEVKSTTNNKRRSLFLPPDVTVTEQTKTSDKEYIKKLKLEEESWKQSYNEQKQQKKTLLRELENRKPQLIDYSLFDEEEINYINAGPDVAKFIKEAEDLQNMIKIVSLQYEAKRQEYKLTLDRIENSCNNITSKLIN